MEHTAGSRRNKVSYAVDGGIQEFLKDGHRAFFLSSPLVEKAALPDAKWSRPMHLAKLHFIVDSIIRQRLGVARLSSRRKEHVNLKSKVVERFCHWRHSKDAKLFLQSAGIIESDGEYLPGMKSTGYRLTESAWKAGISPVPIASKRIGKYNQIHRDIRKAGNEKLEAEGIRIDFLRRHLDKLELDEAWAERHLEQLYAKVGESGRWEDAWAFHAKAFSISTVMNKNWRFTQCRAGRLHYPITNLKKDVRRKLRYNGETLVEADVSCCQPLIAATLYGNDTASRKERREYLAAIRSGRFYEELGSKKDVLTWVFFGGQTTTFRGSLETNHPVWEAFFNQFPILARVLMFSKAKIVHWNRYKGDSDLALKLQSAESKIFIETVLGKIASKYPEIPAFPIHDCIMTTEENYEFVSLLIKEAFMARIGIEPVIHKEKAA